MQRHEIGARVRRPRRPPPPVGLRVERDARPRARARARGATTAPASSAASTWKVTLSAPDCGDLLRSGAPGRRPSGGSRSRRRARGSAARSSAARPGPIVTGGTKWPSPTSKWKMRHAGVRAAPRSARRGRRSPPRRATARPRPSASSRPAHRGDPTARGAEAGDEEAARAVDVRQRQQELRPARVAELRPLGCRAASTARPDASTTASFSSALIVQTE